MQQSASVDIFARYESLFVSLKSVIKESENRVIRDIPDELFSENVNFFVKSYLISVCSYLEAYLQDVAFKYTQELNLRISSANIPHNFIHWKMVNGLKDKNLKYEVVDLSVSKGDISSNISANPYRTLKLFQLLGIDLSAVTGFQNNRDLVNTVVTKRNNIVHHNNDAADVAFGDLITYIDVILVYMKSIDEAAR